MSDREIQKDDFWLPLFVVVLGTWKFNNLSINSTAIYITLVATIRSLGMGLAMMPMTTAGMNTIETKNVGRASALSNVCRQVAASFGIAMLIATMQGRQNFHFAHMAESLTPDSPAIGLLQGAGEGAAASSLYTLWGMASKQSLVLAIDDTFLVAALLVAIAIPATFFLGSGKRAPQGRASSG